MQSNAHLQVRPVARAAPAESEPSDVRLVLPARPENVGVIRHVLGAFALALRLPEPLVEDLRLAVTEACTNVVRHAYPDGGRGTVEVSMRPAGELVQIVVSDRGRGIGSSIDTSGPGLGLPMIAAIADSVELVPLPGGGSRIAMAFSRYRTGVAA
jgi:serine/threonine-protein kinase RsbW